MEGGASVAATGVKIVAKNQKAYHEYFIEEKFETGIELSGTEVKSIRLGNLSLKEAWCQIKDGELFIRQMHIAPYEQGNIFNKDPLRPRRLLMHKREIARLFGKENPIMTLTMEDGGKIVAELYPEKAPQSVRNFISLANKGFYDGLIFHRVISGFMIQGGCPQGTGMGGPGYCIKGEFKLNGVKNNLSHKRGVLSMARAQSPNSAGSQFFIMHEDGEFLDGQYAAFGKVLEGMDVVDKIAAVKTDGNDRPLSEQKIATIRVDTKGEEYPEPDKLRDPYGRF